LVGDVRRAIRYMRNKKVLTSIKTIKRKLKRMLNYLERKIEIKRTKKANEAARKPNRRFSHAQGMAKQRNIIWTLDFTDFCSLIEEPCFYCQNQLGAPVETGSGLDRLDNTRGYELGNVVSCCQQCNEIKMDKLTPEETIAAVDAILTVRNKNKPISMVLSGESISYSLQASEITQQTG